MMDPDAEATLTRPRMSAQLAKELARRVVKPAWQLDERLLSWSDHGMPQPRRVQGSSKTDGWQQRRLAREREMAVSITLEWTFLRQAL